jgi:hypothetical protein
MMTDNIYVDLFSNSSLDIYPNNRVSSFKVKLHQPIDLKEQGEYECALAQMICPATTSVKTEGQIILSTFPEGMIQRIGGSRQEMTFPFNTSLNSLYRAKPQSIHQTNSYKPETRFSSTQPYSYIYDIPKEKTFEDGKAIVNFLNSLFSTNLSSDVNSAFADIIQSRTLPHGEQFPATFLINSQGLHVNIRDPGFSIAISGALARILGFDLADNQWLILETVGQYRFPGQKADLDASRPSLLTVYTNIILPHRVGDTSAPLIRACTVPKNKGSVGEFMNFEFDSLHYLPVAVKYIQEIEVEVRGNDG